MALANRPNDRGSKSQVEIVSVAVRSMISA